MKYSTNTSTQCIYTKPENGKLQFPVPQSMKEHQICIKLDQQSYKAIFAISNQIVGLYNELATELGVDSNS